MRSLTQSRAASPPTCSWHDRRSLRNSRGGRSFRPSSIRKTTLDLGRALIGLIDGGCLKEYTDDGSDITRIYHHQLAACTYEVLPGPGKLLRWSVLPSRGHDDLLISTALTARLDEIDWRDRTARGRAGFCTSNGGQTQRYRRFAPRRGHATPDLAHTEKIPCSPGDDRCSPLPYGLEDARGLLQRPEGTRRGGAGSAAPAGSSWPMPAGVAGTCGAICSAQRAPGEGRLRRRANCCVMSRRSSSDVPPHRSRGTGTEMIRFGRLGVVLGSGSSPLR